MELACGCIATYADNSDDSNIEIELCLVHTKNCRGVPARVVREAIGGLRRELMPSKEYEVKTTSTRTLQLSKLDDGNYQVKLHWGRGDQTLATLVITPVEWKKLASFSEGLKRK